MFDKLAGIGLRGKRAAEHDEDEDAKAAAKAAEDEENENAKAAEDDDEDEDAKAKAAEGDEDEDEEKEAKAAASLRRATKAADAKFQAKAKAIKDLCDLASRPELAGEYMASGVSQAAVREHLLTLRADESGAGDIAGQTGPNGSPGVAAAMWDKAIEKNAKLMGLNK